MLGGDEEKVNLRLGIRALVDVAITVILSSHLLLTSGDVPTDLYC